MTQIDQFESVFKAAVKQAFEPEAISIESVLVITDLEPYPTELLSGRVRSFLEVLGNTVAWTEVSASGSRTPRDLLQAIERERPDLVVTFRNLHEGDTRSPFGLGIHLDALTQATTTPILVLPDPNGDGELSHALKDTSRVLVVTDHLTGDSHLVSYGAHLTRDKGTLYLAHVEDDTVFDRYKDAISKIPTIDTEPAAESIKSVLLKGPRDFIASCRKNLSEDRITVESVVRMGHQLHGYKQLIRDQEIDLLVFNTKDDDQLAMHGLAYPLAVEVRGIPILML